MIVSNGAELRLIWIPAWEKLDLSACISWLTSTLPVAYCRVKFSWVPALMPAPQLAAPVPGELQVVTPLGWTVQPWADNSLIAVGGEYGHGPWVS